MIRLIFGETYYRGQEPYVYQGDVAGVKTFMTPQGSLGTVDPDSLGLSYEPKESEVPKTAPKAKA